MSVRVYASATLPLLARWWARWSAGEATAVDGPVHAVTDRLRQEYPDGGEEDWEYVALTSAAQDALDLLGEGDPPRRVVVALDVPRVDLRPGGDPTAVLVPDPVLLPQVAAVHVDSAEAEPAVRAVTSHDGVDPGHEDAVERCLDHELGWYASQEVPDLVELGAPPGV